MGKHTFDIEFAGIIRSKSINIIDDDLILENLLIFIENDVDKMEEIRSNSKKMKYWAVIWAIDIQDANKQLDKITGSESMIKNLIIRGHGSNNSIVLSFEFGEEDVVDDRAINIQGVDLRNFMSPRINGDKNLLVYTDGGMMSELKYESIKALKEIRNKIRTDAVVCFSNCNVGNDTDLGVGISNLLERSVLFNLGEGATSGVVSISKKNPETGEKVPGTTKRIRKLLLPRSISTTKTRHKGFILYPINGEGSELKGEVIVNDSKDTPLEIKDR